MKALINGRIMTMAGQEIENGFILWDNGKIIEVGAGMPTFQVDDTIDAQGNYVLPGFVDPHCHIGMWGDGVGFEGEDGNESVDPVTPHLRAIDSIYSDDRCFVEAREAGVTTVVTGPGSANILGGQFAALKTYGRYVDEMVLRAPVAVKVALGENPKNIYHEKKQSPTTRMASAAILRETLFKAQEYDNAIMLHETNAEDNTAPDFDIKLDILRSVLSGDLPLKIHAHRSDDIVTAIRVAEEFSLDYTIEHCTEGYMIADVLVEKGVKAIVGPILCDRSKIELKNLDIKAPGILSKKGVKIALMTDHPVIPIQHLPLCAAVAAREGMDETEALKAITIYAAELNKIDDRVGSLEAGKDADIVIFNGHPLVVKTKVIKTIINGDVVYEA
ncbi:MAG: amidohydrolase [Clostridia bacterium]